MPTMAALSVKKADETTNITYDVLTPSPGDGGVAVWRQDTGAAAGMPVGQRATLTVGAGFNGPRTARRLTLTFKRPYSYIDANGKRFAGPGRAFGLDRGSAEHAAGRDRGGGPPGPQPLRNHPDQGRVQDRLLAGLNTIP